MNQKNLNQLIRNYLEYFEELNNETNREYIKWTAVNHFQMYWDINEDNFASMFKNAVSGTSFLINNRFVQPTAGIIRLAERPELTETIRSLFRSLFENDGGDLVKRQNRIEHFVKTVNLLLAEYEPGRWRYKHDFRTVLSYLNMYSPADNFLYKSTQAYQFRNCIEYGDDFGYGTQFSLSKYYHMCDQLVEFIQHDSELMARHHERLTEEMYQSDHNHLLLFDLIYCTGTYRLFKGIELFEKPEKKGINKKTKAAEKNEKVIAELQVRLNTERDEMQKALELAAQIDDFNTVGLQVRHTAFGKGIIIEQETDKITVQFKNQSRVFQLPNAFTEKYLKTDDSEILELMKQKTEADTAIYRCKAKINQTEHELKRLGAMKNDK